MTNFFGLPELEHKAMTMKSLSDASHVRDRLIDLLEEADFECAAGSRFSVHPPFLACAYLCGLTATLMNDIVLAPSSLRGIQ